MADRFFAPGPYQGGEVRLDGDEARHLARVRRVPEGAFVELFDGEGNAWRAQVERIDKSSALLRLETRVETSREAPCRLTLAVSFPKGDRADWLVEKATELGVDRLIPLLTERTVVDPKGSKLDRMRRAVVEASKQCGRDRLMAIGPPIAWSKLLAGPADPATHRLMAHPGGGPASPIAPGSGAILAVGPEGGFTDAEVEAGRAAGWSAIGLGEILLRIETAALAGTCAVFNACARRDSS